MRRPSGKVLTGTVRLVWGAPPASEALTFRTGANEWTPHQAWPPVKDVTERRLYFQGDGKLAFTPPPASKQAAYDAYLSDPHSPVPYRPRPITLGRGWSTWQVEDQRFVHGRPDVRTYVTDPLTDPVVVSGRISAKLFAGTSLVLWVGTLFLGRMLPYLRP